MAENKLANHSATNGRRPPPTWLLTLLPCALLAHPAFALDSSKSIFQYNCRTWTRQNGLPANGVNAIAQTRDGYLWLGTAMGLARFDGVDFKLFDMSNLPDVRSTIITSLAPSQSGGLWLGLERGSFGFCDGRTVSLDGRNQWGGVNLNVHAVMESRDGDLWIAAQTRLARLGADRTYEAMLTGATAQDRYDVTATYQGADGRIWIGTVRRGLYYRKDGELTKFHDKTLDGLTVRAIAEDSRGQLWVGTEHGLLCYDSNGRRKPLPFPWYETTALLADRNGAVWVATTGGGLVRYVGDETATFRKTDGLSDDFVLALAEDQEGNLWVGTRNGLNQFSDVKIPTFGKNEGLTSDINVAVSASPRGGLWIATGDGFTYFNGTAQNYSTNIGLSNAYVKRVFEAGDGDVYLLDGSMQVDVFSGGKIVAVYPNKTWPMAICEGDEGVVVAVGGDLFRAGKNYYEPYTFTNAEKPSLSWVFNMASDPDGSIWIACDNGICRVKDGTYRLWTKDDGLPDAKALWVCRDNEGVIWAGLEGGMARIKNGQVRAITRADGLFDNVIYSIVPDDRGSLWVDSSRGFFRLSRQNANDFADRKTDHVDCVAYDGLEAVKSFERTLQEPSGCRTLDGRVWFPTAQGLAMIDPTNILGNLVRPQVHIQSIRANGREVDRAGAAGIRPGKGELEFNYAGLSYVAPQKVNYRYKLDGYDQDWVQAGTRRSAFYTNLRPGRYNFHVQASNADGLWSNSDASFRIELLPHYYQTAWFASLASLCGLSVLFAAYRLRVRHLRRRQEQLQKEHALLETKVTERTTELAKTNAALKNEIEERTRVQQEVERVHAQLLQASREAGRSEVASSVLHNVGNVLNSVNVSASVIAERLENMRLGRLSRAATLMRDNAADLGRFITSDEKGRLLPQYLWELAEHLGREQQQVLGELKDLGHKIEHIKEIVAMQQTYARVSGVLEQTPAIELVESALKMHSGAYVRHAVNVERDYETVPPVLVDKHRVLQILVNLLQNAKHACDESGRSDKKVVVRVKSSHDDRVRIEIEDNGIGIPAENLTRIFSHGFTTRKNGHGFGLHSSALIARELGGNLGVRSAGTGCGATFSLELPTQNATTTGTNSATDDEAVEQNAMV